MKFLIAWLLNAVALFAVAYFMPSIHVDGITAAFIAAAVIGFVNVLVKPLLILLTLPVTILTLGLFILVINGALFYVVAYYLPGFSVKDFSSAVLGAILYSIISWLLSALLLPKK